MRLGDIVLRNRLVTSSSLLGYGMSSSGFYGMSPVALFLPLAAFGAVTTRTLPWDVVERVAFPDGASWARLELIGDDYLPMLAIQAVDGQRAVDGIRRVRALHAAAARR